jgi:hypothetical protein
MVEIQTIEKRSRGRPQLRCDDDTKTVIVEAANDQFHLSGYAALDESTLATLGLREGLERMLTAYGMLTLTEETVSMTRLVVGESDRFPEIAAAFYNRAIIPTNTVMENWLRRQCDRGLIELEDPHEACGMLRGMMIMEPQRAATLGQRPAPRIEEIVARTKMCADLFLKGCAR